MKKIFYSFFRFKPKDFEKRLWEKGMDFKEHQSLTDLLLWNMLTHARRHQLVPLINDYQIIKQSLRDWIRINKKKFYVLLRDLINLLNAFENIMKLDWKN